jgi:hypothetical protein
MILRIIKGATPHTIPYDIGNREAGEQSGWRVPHKRGSSCVLPLFGRVCRPPTTYAMIIIPKGCKRVLYSGVSPSSETGWLRSPLVMVTYVTRL